MFKKLIKNYKKNWVEKKIKQIFSLPAHLKNKPQYKILHYYLDRDYIKIFGNKEEIETLLEMLIESK